MARFLNIDPLRDALVVVDVQNDFCEGGALAVPHGDEVVAPINRALGLRWAATIGTRDWHPADHGSFRAHGGPWPAHCVRGTRGAAFHPLLDAARFQFVVDKGTAPTDLGYSMLEGTDLAERLRSAGVRRVFVGGLATDYCVKATVLDLAREGFEVFVLTDAVRAVNVRPVDEKDALAEMERGGARWAKTTDLRGEGA
jgi:nicotinamidase/pyrazinamidase